MSSRDVRDQRIGSPFFEGGQEALGQHNSDRMNEDTEVVLCNVPASTRTVIGLDLEKLSLVGNTGAA